MASMVINIYIYTIFIAFGHILNQKYFINSTRVLEEETYNISRLERFKCEDAVIQCSGQGICNNELDDCICFDGYATVFDFDDFVANKQRCNYKLKKQIYAIAFAIFLSFGSAHFYLGNYLIGIFQMIIFVLIFSFGTFMTVRLSMKHTKSVTNTEFKRSLKSMVMICFFSLIFLFWYMFDIFMILFDAYRDSNNIELHSMNR